MLILLRTSGFLVRATNVLNLLNKKNHFFQFFLFLSSHCMLINTAYRRLLKESPEEIRKSKYTNRTRKKSVNFVPASQRVEISNLVEFFLLKGTLVQPKPVTGLSSCDTEGPWKVWGKTDNWFQIQPRKKICEFCSSEPKGQNFKFGNFFFLKGTLVQPKSMTQEFHLVTLKCHGKFGEN